VTAEPPPASPDEPEAGPPAGGAGSDPDAERPGRARASAARNPGAWAIFLGTTVIGLVTDLATKAWAFATVAGRPVAISREAVLAAAPDLHRLVPQHEPVVAVPGVLNFTLVLNPGAVFGIGAGRRMFFVAFTLVAIAFAAWMFTAWTSARDRMAHVGLGLLVAGGLGNLYDRLAYASVRDFIHPLPGAQLPFGLRWPGGSSDLWPYVSNVADAYLLIGIALLLIYSWRRPS